MTTIGSRLREARLKAGLTEEELAFAVDPGGLCAISALSIKGWEADRYPPHLMALRELAVALSVSADWLLGLADGPEGEGWIEAWEEEDG